MLETNVENIFRLHKKSLLYRKNTFIAAHLLFLLCNIIFIAFDNGEKSNIVVLLVKPRNYIVNSVVLRDQ